MYECLTTMEIYDDSLEEYGSDRHMVEAKNFVADRLVKDGKEEISELVN